jgi:hypothetical protein
MPSQEEIQKQRELLDAHRNTLSVYLRQRALQGEAFVPPSSANGIKESRNHIRNIKKTFRGWGVVVDDHPDDEEQHLPDGDGGTGGGRGSFLSFVGIIGILIFFAGIGLFGYAILSFMMVIFSWIATQSPRPPDLSQVPIHFIAIGAGLGFIGLLLSTVGGFSLLRRGRRTRR